MRSIRYISIVALPLGLSVLLMSGCMGAKALPAPIVPVAAQMSLTAGGTTAVIESRSGRVRSLRVGPGHEEMCQPHPGGGETPYGYVEVKDLHSGKVYSPIHSRRIVNGWQTAGRIAGAQIEFVEQYAEAPFTVHHVLTETAAGIRWEVRIAALPAVQPTRTSPAPSSEELNRSLQVTWVLPVPVGWHFWGPNDVVAQATDAITPHRFIYGHTDTSPNSIVIPLVGVWGLSGGGAVFSPPDVRKCQIVFEVAGGYFTDMPRGGLRHAEDLQTLRVEHNFVGVRPGKELSLAICVAGTRPDWRSVMGTYVRRYRELFEPIPQTRKVEGSHRTMGAHAFQPKDVANYRQQGVTDIEVHGHFVRYGEYLPDGALEDPHKTWLHQNYKDSNVLSVNAIRQTIKQLSDGGIAPFVYFYNVHAQPALVEEKFTSELMRSEDGKVNIQYEGEPALHAQPDSAFGLQLLTQLDRLLKAYEQAPGIFLDNYSIQWVDFAHDDGVTMIHNRPAYDMNRNHQDVGTLCMARIHKAGKITMVNKLSTIESAKGADMVLLEPLTAQGLKEVALACAVRPVFPTEYGSDLSTEKQMQHLLIWGGLPAQALAPYRPLTDGLIGKRWVFDADPVTLPRGYSGQIFRIDPHAAHGGDVVVTLVNLQASYKDKQLTEGLTVTVRLPEIEEFTKVTWLSAERYEQKPELCEFDRDGKSIVVHMPLVGAAGVLRCSR